MSPATAPDRPRVSVVVPARDAHDTLAAAVTAVLGQLHADDEVVLAVADAATRDVANALARADGRVRVVDNPTGTTPAALNRAIEACRGDVVVRVDTHARVPDDYIERLLALLAGTGAVNVGGRQVATATDGFAAAVALAMNSRLGSGGAAYRTAGSPRAVDTVYLGAFRRAALDAVGGYDERFVRNQDAELNLRLREAGGVVWLDPALEVAYRPRSRPAALWRQYLGYGRFRRLTRRTHPGSLRARQAAPVALVVVLAVALVALPRTVVPFVLVWGGYGLAVLLGSALLARSRPTLVPAVVVALVVMHVAWGVGFLLGPPRRAGEA